MGDASAEIVCVCVCVRARARVCLPARASWPYRSPDLGYVDVFLWGCEICGFCKAKATNPELIDGSDMNIYSGR